MSGSDDRTLRERFAALRAAEADAAPSFESVRGRRRASHSKRRAPAFAIAAVTAALVIGFFVSPPERGPGSGRDAEQVSITEWRSPTAFLLTSPAGPLLQATPAVGERWVMVP